MLGKEATALTEELVSEHSECAGVVEPSLSGKTIFRIES
jgi:hypothetical protein